MGRLGFEPRTSRLKAECSTTELATLFLLAVNAAQRLLNLAHGLNRFAAFFTVPKIRTFFKHSGGLKKWSKRAV